MIRWSWTAFCGLVLSCGLGLSCGPSTDSDAVQGTEAADSAFPVTAAPPPAKSARLVDVVRDTVTMDGEALAVDRGFLDVPARWDSAGDARLRIRFVRFRSLASASRAPLFYLAAGPGASGVRLMSGREWAEFVSFAVSFGDFVAFDERGTGGSDLADLMCERPGAPLDRPSDSAERLARLATGFRGCVDSLWALGFGPRVFSVAQTAADVHAPRHALGYERVFLMGESYGTHLALAVLRREPDAVLGAFLSGIEGPDHSLKSPGQIQETLERLARITRADPRYRAILDDLIGDLIVLRDVLAENPRRVRLASGETVVVGEWDLRRWVAGGMGRRARMAALPARVVDMKGGNFTALAEWALRDREPWESRLMAAAIECASGASAARLVGIRTEAPSTFAGDVVNFPYPDICALAGFPALPDSFRTPIRSDAPVVFLSGGLDARTPPSNVDELIGGFPRAVHFVVRGEGHTPFYFTEPYFRLVRDLMEGQPITGRGPPGRDLVLDAPEGGS